MLSKSQALKDLRRDVRAFLRLAGGERVQVLQLGRQELHDAKLQSDPARTNPGASQPPRRVGIDELPRQRRGNGGILRQQRVQERRTAARQAGDENGPFDRPGDDMRIDVFGCVETQQIFEAAHDIEPGGQAAEAAEICLGVAGMHQSRERGLERRVGERRPARLAQRVAEHFVDVERGLLRIGPRRRPQITEARHRKSNLARPEGNISECVMPPCRRESVRRRKRFLTVGAETEFPQLRCRREKTPGAVLFLNGLFLRIAEGPVKPAPLLTTAAVAMGS